MPQNMNALKVQARETAVELMAYAAIAVSLEDVAKG